MKYKIKYNYDTGDSFSHTDGLEDYIELEWKNLDIAKANIKRIEEHYKQHKAIQSYFDKRPIQEILEENESKDWFVKNYRLICWKGERTDTNYLTIDPNDKDKFEKQGYSTDYIIDETTAENQIILYTDFNKPFQFWPSWLGYFESLNYVEIVPDKSDMKIEF